MNIYPVCPVYATGAFHLHCDITEEMDNLMITYANGTKLSNMMFRRLGISYDTKVATYLSQQPTENFATFEEFIKGSYPPSGRTLHDLFHNSQHSKLTLYMLPGAKAMFTISKGSTKEIVHLGIVRSTAASQISHLVTKAKGT